MKLAIAATLSLALYCSATLADADSSSATTTVAAAQRSFAVMSLIGDGITVVVPKNGTYDHVERNDVQFYPDPSDVLDMAALKATGAAIKKIVPDTKPALLATDSAVLRKQQSQLIKDNHLVDADGLLADLRQTGATDFLLIAKHRSAADLHLAYDTIGTGTLYGAGFYVDGYTRLVQVNSEEEGRGFLAPYAYFTIFLIDVATLEVKQQVDITAGYAISNSQNKSETERNPWNILDANEKMMKLGELIQNNIIKNVPGMIAGAPVAAPASAQSSAN